MAVAISIGLMAAAPHAKADFVPGGYQIGSQQFGLTGGTFSAGAFKGTWNGTPIIFWCIELTQTFSFGTHFTTYTPSVASNTLLSQLFTRGLRRRAELHRELGGVPARHLGNHL